MTDDEIAIVRRALSEIANGRNASELESDLLDFKEDPAVRGKASNPDAQLVDILANEAVCFSNGDTSFSFIVLGVSDRGRGEEAFSGTDRPTDWLVKKIYANTVPPIQVEPFELEQCGQRIIALRVPRGLTLYRRPKGQASIRRGSSCVPLREEERRRIAFDRANPDLTAGVSEKSLHDLDPQAIDQARLLLARKRSSVGDNTSVPPTAAEICRELGVLTPDGRLTVAGEILFAMPPAHRVTVRHLFRQVPGSEPVTTEITGPLITASLRIRNIIADKASVEVARTNLLHGQEVSIPAFPAAAVDELLSNAFAHRDWAATSAIVVDQSPISLSVWSPGELPPGVDASKLLTTQSIPRNPTLMKSMRMLGLVEESSRGFDRIWISMLSSGHQIPEVDAEGPYVKVSLSANRIDTQFVKAVARLSDRYGHENLASVSGLIIVRELNERRFLTVNNAARVLQTNEREANDILDWFTNVGLLEQIPGRSQWTLSSQAHALLRPDKPTPALDTSAQEWILTQSKAGQRLTAKHIADELGLDRQHVTQLLRQLRSRGLLQVDPDGPQRGPNTGWIVR